jgi:hypothetical protein
VEDEEAHKADARFRRVVVSAGSSKKLRYAAYAAVELGRGLHSSTFQLNSSALYGIGGVRKGLCNPCQGDVRGW